MKFEFQLSYLIIGLLICCVILPFFPSLHVPLMNGLLVTGVETIQVLMLFGFAVATFLMMKPYALTREQKMFWLWSISWWIMLLGRSTSWGRDYFPEVPKVYFRAISVVMIAPVLFMLASPALRAEIAYKFKHAALSFWAIVLVLIGLLASDGIEHSRPVLSLLLTDVAYKDLIEECYEFPLIIGLFLIAYPLLKKDLNQRK